MDGPHDVFCKRPSDTFLAEVIGYTLNLANENIPLGDVTSATLRIRASCADLILKGRVLFINGRGNIPRQNVWINLDDVNDHLKGEACYMFAVLSEIYLCWEGLLLKRSIVGEDTVYTRVGRGAFYCLNTMACLLEDLTQKISKHFLAKKS